MRRRAVEGGALMSEIGAPIYDIETGAPVRHTPGNLIRSVGVRRSTEISPKLAEERIASIEARPLRLEQPKESAAIRYKALIRVFAAMAAEHDAGRLFPLLASELRQVVNFDFIGISQYDEATNKTHWHSTLTGSGSDRGTTDGATPEQALTQWVHEHQLPLVIPFLERETRFPCATTLVEQHGIRSLCALPLTTAHRRIGSLITGSVKPDAYCDEEDVEFLRQVANQIALTVENTLAYGEIQALKDQLAQEKLYLQDEVRS